MLDQNQETNSVVRYIPLVQLGKWGMAFCCLLCILIIVKAVPHLHFSMDNKPPPMVPIQFDNTSVKHAIKNLTDNPSEELAVVTPTVLSDNPSEEKSVVTPADLIETTPEEHGAVNASGLFDNPSIEQDDPRLLEYIRKNHLIPPPPERNTDNIRETSEWSRELLSIFRGKKNGFYIECGANDGQYLSNTYYFDKNYEWSGLLIEANPHMLKQLKVSGRNGWITDACLAIKPYAQKVEFLHRVGKEDYFRGNGIIKPGPGNPTPPPQTHSMNDYVSAGPAECFPLYSLLLAMNVTTVDYFSLDVEGVEYKILKNIPFDKLTIKVISVEFNVIPEGKKALLELFTSNGYEVVLDTYRELFMVLSKYKHEFGKQGKQ